MAPVIRALMRNAELDPVVCATGQHDDLLGDALDAFGLSADHDLRVIRANQSLHDLTARVITGLVPILNATAPRIVLVHGDTATTLSAALASFYARLPVGHVEAGLRSRDIDNPFPEEANRILSDQLATYCYAPTAGNRANLLREGIDEKRIVVTGNTAVDALLLMRDQIAARPESYWQKRLAAVPAVALSPESRLVIVTAHRRESFGPPLARICDAIEFLAREHADWHFLYPVHPNPNVVQTVRSTLSGLGNVHLVDPIAYEPFVFLLDRAYLILTDSGGLQEEAPSLGKPVIVLRDTTERREGVDAGSALLAGTERQRIIDLVEAVVSDPARYAAMATGSNPYGDGRAAERIVDHLRGVL